ncbi:MAG: SUMF1/EgtB/PvdO family nonheme iron enzyme [Candidatus Glassbacteria bacterium]|nr:SUMF1/EgtB/PvdO family nonheme iron enzyme [Candidatus Glassbacteria bacterium]
MPARSGFLHFAFLLVLLVCLSGTTYAAPGRLEAAGAVYREDINGDGKVIITDVIALLLLGRDNPSDPRADYDRSGSYTVSDAIALLINIMSGKLTPLEQETHHVGERMHIQGINLAYIPEGSFRMGSTTGPSNERPVHEVSLDAFWMSVTEVTQAQYERVAGTNPSGIVNETNPVEHVSWYDAVLFCNLLSELAGFEPCYDRESWACNFSRNGFRLPTEAEWEYACRAGTSTKYYTGDLENDLSEAGWWSGNTDGSQQPVAGKVPNNWGLFDMHGNVFEWCNDMYDQDYYSVSPDHNPTGPETGYFRVLRSACACSSIIYQSSSSRGYSSPNYKGQTVGMRIVRRP